MMFNMCVVTKLETILPTNVHTSALDRDEIFLLLANMEEDTDPEDATNKDITEYHPVDRVNKVIRRIIEGC